MIKPLLVQVVTAKTLRTLVYSSIDEEMYWLLHNAGLIKWLC